MQKFRLKNSTAIAHAAAPPIEELLRTIAITRLLFGPSTNIDAPPNLTPGELMAMITLDQLVLDRSLGLSAVASWIVRQLHRSVALSSRCNVWPGATASAWRSSYWQQGTPCGQLLKSGPLFTRLPL